MSIPANVSTPDQTMVPLAHIASDEGAQTRAKISSSVVRGYAAAMAQQQANGGLRFPPIVLFTDGKDYWLGDGWHRVLAARKAGLTEIAAEVRPGTRRDALLFAVGANISHGLPRNNADKRKAVGLLLTDAEWSQWNDREIARHCQVSNRFVSNMRRSASVNASRMRVRKVQRAGTVYEMNLPAKVAGTDNPTPESPPARPTAPATDALGIPVPESRAHVFAASADFQEAKELFDRLAGVIDRIAHKPGGDLYRLALVLTAPEQGRAVFASRALKQAQCELLDAQPYCAYCPTCEEMHPGRANPLCKKCAGRGWTSRPAFESSTYRQHIMQLCNPK